LNKQCNKTNFEIYVIVISSNN